MTNLDRVREIYNEGGAIGISRGLCRWVIFHLCSRKIRSILYTRKRYWKNRFKYDAVANPMKTIWVPTREITHKNIGQPFPSKKGNGFIQDGDWDKDTILLEDIKLYDVYYERFVQNKSWSETGLIELAERSIERKGHYYNYKNIKDVLEYRGAYIDELYERIKKQGYKSQHEAKHYLDEIKHEEYIPMEIQINITRNGELLFYTGHNRMILAKILEIEQIPVMVLGRHKKWQKIREKVAATNSTNNIQSISQHPDLRDIL